MTLILIRRHVSILVEMEKNGHNRARATLFPSLQLFFSLVKLEVSYMPVQENQSVKVIQLVRRLTNLKFREVFVFALQIQHVCH